MSEERIKIGVLISGSGTNLQAVIDASRAGGIDGDVMVVISNHASAYGLERARKAGIDAVFIDRGEFERKRDYDLEILRNLQERDVDLVVMAGYMRLLGTEVLSAYPGSVLNIHPALLPSFPGASGIRDAWDYGVKVTGVTVHFADEVFDRGPIIAQEAVAVEEGDSMEDLEAKIHEIEHRIYPKAIQAWAQGRLRVEGRRVHIDRA
jgi:phosphoribosylglycinamide formyltransferase-1